MGWLKDQLRNRNRRNQMGRSKRPESKFRCDWVSYVKVSPAPVFIWLPPGPSVKDPRCQSHRNFSSLRNRMPISATSDCDPSDSFPAVDLVLRSTASAQSQSFNCILLCDLPDCDPPIKSGSSISRLSNGPYSLRSQVLPPFQNPLIHFPPLIWSVDQRPALNRIAAFQLHSLFCHPRLRSSD